MYHLAINETWCFVLALRLQQQGYVVSTFTDVRAFLGEVAQFDLAVIDFSMPAPVYQLSMDGPELIHQVKQQLENPPILVLVSSFFTPNLLKNMREICPEADAVLRKQVETDEMFTQIRQLLENRPPLKDLLNRSYSEGQLG